MLQRAVGVQVMTGDTGLLFHLRRKKWTPEEMAKAFMSATPDPYIGGMGISIDMVTGDARSAPMLDLRKEMDRKRLMNMMVDYLMANTRPLPKYVRRVDHPPGFRQAMNDIARITRRGVGNVLIANTEGYRKLNGSWRPHTIIQPICLPLDDREPFALLGYHGKNRYDTGAMLAFRIRDEEYAMVKSIWGRYGTKEQWDDFMQNQMRFVRPIFVGNDKPEFCTATYWRRLV